MPCADFPCASARWSASWRRPSSFAPLMSARRTLVDSVEDISRRRACSAASTRAFLVTSCLFRTRTRTSGTRQRMRSVRTRLSRSARCASSPLRISKRRSISSSSCSRTPTASRSASTSSYSSCSLCRRASESLTEIFCRRVSSTAMVSCDPSLSHSFSSASAQPASTSASSKASTSSSILGSRSSASEMKSLSSANRFLAAFLRNRSSRASARMSSRSTLMSKRCSLYCKSVRAAFSTVQAFFKARKRTTARNRR
mmetsp:Transcript_30787/g.103720  ORF Transcript_30787/g.103720 Transcript_30787/m.103720 type:complete len:256 (-) Transcript_30787:263-1030(-)